MKNGWKSISGTEDSMGKSPEVGKHLALLKNQQRQYTFRKEESG